MWPKGRKFDNFSLSEIPCHWYRFSPPPSSRYPTYSLIRGKGKVVHIFVSICFLAASPCQTFFNAGFPVRSRSHPLPRCRPRPRRPFKSFQFRSQFRFHCGLSPKIDPLICHLPSSHSDAAAAVRTARRRTDWHDQRASFIRNGVISGKYFLGFCQVSVYGGQLFLSTCIWSGTLSL